MERVSFMQEQETTENIIAPEHDKDRKISSRTLSGKVISNASDKGVSVAIERLIKHPVYRKFIKRTTKVLAHDPDNSCDVGDFVSIKEIKPVSKHKSWQVVEVLKSVSTK
tara:strand:- start:122 stop:451 length:330 start_codon:yes stop_codon:yes gene_type:complete